MNELASLAAVYDATREIGLSDDLDRPLERVLARAQELIGFDHCTLMLYDAESRTLSVRSVRGYAERAHDVLRLSLPEGRGISGWAVANRQAVRVGDVRKDPRYVVGLNEARSNAALASESCDAIEVGCSAGIALHPDDAADSKALLRAADLALYKAKARGRNEISVAPSRRPAEGERFERRVRVELTVPGA